MKTIYKKIAAVALAVPMLLTSCIEETFPTSGVTTGQVGDNSQGLDGIIKGMPAFMKKYHTWGDYSFNFGYPSIFNMMNVQTQDMIQNPTGYDWFSFWAEVSMNLNSNMLMSQTNWYYLNFMVRSANDVISAIGTPSNDYQITAMAQAHVFRASTYLDMARIYEFLPNADISGVNEAGNDVTGLTVPVNTPEMTDEQLSNNPRLPHDKMVEFLVKDLQTAIDLFTSSSEASADKTLPSLAVAYGVMARVYMWDENYPKAAEYAKLAYQTSGATPLSQSEWLNTSTGFNSSTASAWMWAIQYEGNDDPVQTSDNWTSFASPETRMGYAGNYDAYFCIDKSLYDQISNADFRKLTFKAPEGHPLSGREAVGNTSKYDGWEPYTAFKFRPGAGNYTDRTVAYATAVPLMRVEEMYFIEAEALAHTSPANGKAALESFMKQYRYNSYTCAATDPEGVINEIFLQKRIEFWGEGIIFFDFKRLNKGVIRAYEGSNWPETQRFNTIGRPGWMNWPFVDYEGSFNEGVKGYLNPNVGEKFTPIMDATE